MTLFDQKEHQGGGMYMAATTTHPITVEQYENSFEGYPGLRDELINGRIVMNPSPKPLHQQVTINILLLLKNACEGTDYTVNTNTGFRFSAQNSELGPDVFVVSKAAMRDAVAADDYFNTPPLLVVEVQSEPRRRTSEKVDIYLRAGVVAVWVIDLPRRAVTVHAELEKRPYRELSEIALPFPLKGSVKVADFFAGLPESHI